MPPTLKKILLFDICVPLGCFGQTFPDCNTKQFTKSHPCSNSHILSLLAYILKTFEFKIKMFAVYKTEYNKKMVLDLLPLYYEPHKGLADLSDLVNLHFVFYYLLFYSITQGITYTEGWCLYCMCSCKLAVLKVVLTNVLCLTQV